MTCQQTQELLHGYIDGELDLVNNLNLERHFEQCENCTVEYNNQLALRTLFKEHAQYFDAPEILKKRIQKTVAIANEIEPRRKGLTQNWWRIAAAALILFLSALLIWTVVADRARPQTNGLLAQEVVSSHVRSLMVDHLADVLSSDQHTVKPWFEGKVDFAPVVKDLSPEGFPLFGGRLDYVDNRSVAALVYQRHKHYINLFIWPASNSSDQVNHESTQQGFKVICWTASGTDYCAVSDVSDADLQEFVRLIRN
jgi:Predicted transmembrane transcriptional regulator (anti-sigma factor)